MNITDKPKIQIAQNPVTPKKLVEYASDLRIKKIVLAALAFLTTAFIVSTVFVLASLVLPAVVFPVAFVLFKVVAIINAVAFGIFGIAKLLNVLAPKLPRPLEIAANAVHAFITETFSLLFVLPLYAINPVKENPDQIDKNQKPILLVHGLYFNSSIWMYYRHILNKSEVGSVFTINLGNPCGSIEEHSLKVKEKMAEIQKITGQSDIMLVGHSMGGLVALNCALNHKETNQSKITDVVTIGSPLQGTHIAKIACGKAANEMRRYSEFTNQLVQKVLDDQSCNYFHIGTETDELVIPYESSLLLENKKARRLKVSNLGHAGIMLSDQIIDEVIDFYKTSNKNTIEVAH
jgi:predicted alpha/beta hydrolase family esterase